VDGDYQELGTLIPDNATDIICGFVKGRVMFPAYSSFFDIVDRVRPTVAPLPSPSPLAHIHAPSWSPFSMCQRLCGDLGRSFLEKGCRLVVCDAPHYRKDQIYGVAFTDERRSRRKDGTFGRVSW